eukprot:263572_1
MAYCRAVTIHFNNEEFAVYLSPILKQWWDDIDIDTYKNIMESIKNTWGIITEPELYEHDYDGKHVAIRDIFDLVNSHELNDELIGDELGSNELRSVDIYIKDEFIIITISHQHQHRQYKFTSKIDDWSKIDYENLMKAVRQHFNLKDHQFKLSYGDIT